MEETFNISSIGAYTALNNADYKYYIKLNDIGATFRRVFLRETEKIATNYEAITPLHI